MAVGGYDTRTVGEDMLLTVRLHRYCREQGIPVVEQGDALQSQVWPDRALCLSLLLFEMLGPLLEGLGYLAFFVTIGLGWAPLPYVLAFLCLAGLLGTALSFAALALEELTFRRYPRALDLLQLFGLAILETVLYRQLNTYWRIRGFVSKFRGVTRWGAQERRGFERTNETEG